MFGIVCVHKSLFNISQQLLRIADLTTAGQNTGRYHTHLVLVRGQLIKQRKLDNHGHVAAYAVFFLYIAFYIITSVLYLSVRLNWQSVAVAVFSRWNKIELFFWAYYVCLLYSYPYCIPITTPPVYHHRLSEDYWYR